MDFTKVLAGKTNLQALLDGLNFEELAIAEAALSQPRLFVACANYRIKLLRERKAAEASLKSLVTRQSIRLRAKYKGMGEKLTEAELKNLLTRNQFIKSAEVELADLETEEEYAKLLLEAYRMRKDALQVIAQAQRAGEYAGKISPRDFPTEGVDSLRRKAQAKYKRGS